MADIDVYLQRQRTGRLIRQGERHIFGYGLDATEALSLTMPLRTESYSSHDLLPVFQMNLLNISSRHWLIFLN